MRTFRAHNTQRRLAFLVLASFTLNCNVGVMQAWQSDSKTKSRASQLVKLEYSDSATLRPLLATLVAQGNASKDVEYSYAQLQKGKQSVDVSVALNVLAEVIYHVYKTREEIVRSFKPEVPTSEFAHQAHDIYAALRALQNVRENLHLLKQDASKHTSDEIDVLYQALGELLVDMPVNDGIDGLLQMLRFVGDTTGEGIRCILVKVAGTVDTIESKLDDCCFSLESKLDTISTVTLSSVCDFTTVFTALDACCFTIDSKIDDCCSTLVVDFQDTWTILGNNCTDVSFDDCCFTSTCDIDEACLSVISWLKTIYRNLRGFSTPTPAQCAAMAFNPCGTSSCAPPPAP